MARIDTLSGDATEPCQLRSFAAEMIAAIAPAALSKNVRLELEDGDEVMVRGDAALLRILLRNLIDNAVRHTPAGTAVRVSIGLAQGQGFLAVSDNGHGIPSEDMDRVAERFYRPLGTSASGSGLGLSIVKRIAEIHGASLQLAPNQDGIGLRALVSFRPN